ncbi:MAG: hypothetical protein NDJ89_16105 [Oligoflexia bacterium]|nr:hypothetical protein [Oligoflexia bacterium]
MRSPFAHSFIALLSLSLASCAGIKIEKNPPAQAQSKPGISFGGPIAGPITVDRGFTCWVKHGLVGFDGVGMTEDEAVANAAKRCKGMFPEGSCERDRCEKTK